MQAHPFAAGGGACPAAERLIRCRKAVDGHEWPVDIRWRGTSVRMVAASSLKRVEFKDEGQLRSSRPCFRAYWGTRRDMGAMFFIFLCIFAG